MKSDKNRRRKAETRNADEAGPSQAKKIKQAESAAQSSGTQSSEQPLTKDDHAKLPKKTTSKGLTTQKPQVEKHIRQAASSVLATINPSMPLSLEEKRAKLAEIKQVGMTTQAVTATPEQERFLLRVFLS
jgi:hypothetical protein